MDDVANLAILVFEQWVTECLLDECEVSVQLGITPGVFCINPDLNEFERFVVVVVQTFVEDDVDERIVFGAARDGDDVC